MSHPSRHTAPKLLLVAATLGITLPASGADRAPSAWREAFQSSPADYEPMSPETERQIVEKFKVPKAIIDQMRPVTAAGTQRFRFAVSAAGPQIRVRISNEAGATPLILSAASIAFAADGFAARPGTIRPLTFGGKPGISIAPGAPALSDPVTLAVAPGTELVSSTYSTGTFALKPQGGGLIAVAAGDQTQRDALDGATPMHGRPIVTGAEVLAPASLRVIATLGDSITDGNRDKPGVLRSWPEGLARRLAARKGGGRYAVVNAGIGGNRILAPSWGEAALARLDRDVLRIDGLSHVIVLEGTNDIGMSGHSVFGDNPEVTADEIIAGFRQIIARGHARDVKVVLATIMPFGAAFSHFSPAKEQIRQAVNQWIRISGEADGVIDFDRLARDPAKPVNMRKDFGGDGLHPGDAGYKAMGEAIDLSLFR